MEKQRYDDEIPEILPWICCMAIIPYLYNVISNSILESDLTKYANVWFQYNIQLLSEFKLTAGDAFHLIIGFQLPVSKIYNGDDSVHTTELQTMIAWLLLHT